MANTATIGGNSAGAINGAINGANTSLAFQGQYDFAENAAPILFQTLTVTPTLLALGGVTSVLAIVLKVLTGTGTQHVYLGLDNAFPPANQIGDIPEGLGTVLIRPCASQPAAIYASVNAGTVVVQYQVIGA